MKGKEILTGRGGGITILGGEPLAQTYFLFELIKSLKPINIAVETSGYVENEIFQRMVFKVDLVLRDIKHTDPGFHTQDDVSIWLEVFKEYYIKTFLL